MCPILSPLLNLSVILCMFCLLHCFVFINIDSFGFKQVQLQIDTCYFKLCSLTLHAVFYLISMRYINYHAVKLMLTTPLNAFGHMPIHLNSYFKILNIFILIFKFKKNVLLDLMNFMLHLTYPI